MDKLMIAIVRNSVWEASHNVNGRLGVMLLVVGNCISDLEGKLDDSGFDPYEWQKEFVAKMTEEAKKI